MVCRIDILVSGIDGVIIIVLLRQLGLLFRQHIHNGSTYRLCAMSLRGVWLAVYIDVSGSTYGWTSRIWIVDVSTYRERVLLCESDISVTSIVKASIEFHSSDKVNIPTYLHTPTTPG